LRHWESGNLCNEIEANNVARRKVETEKPRVNMAASLQKKATGSYPKTQGSPDGYMMGKKVPPKD